jgi:hypothetical protein
MSNEPQDEDSGFRMAPPYDSGPEVPEPSENVIELHIVREMPNLFTGFGTAISEKLLAGLKPLFGSWTEQFSKAFSLNLGQLISPDVLARLRESVPPNWQDIKDPDWDAVLTIMNDGIPLIWVPRASIVGRLMNAESVEDRLAILEHASREIADDCEAVLSEVTAPQLVPLADLTADSGRALRDRHCTASQALSANVFDTWLRDAVRRGVLFTPPKNGGFYENVRSQIKPITDDVRLIELKASGALTPVLMALAKFKPGGPVPTKFGRHATAHAAGSEQYSDVNAVIALMLTTSVLRQAQASDW